MSIEITSLSDLSTDNVVARRELLTQMLRELNPTLDSKRGPVRDLLLTQGATVTELSAANIERYLAGRSMKEITDNPNLADTDLVDSVLSLYRLERAVGAQASGTVTVVLNAEAIVTIRNGAQFVANGRTFETQQAFTSQPSATNSPSDQLLVKLADNLYGFQIRLIDSATGVAGNISKDTVLIPLDEPRNFVKAYASADFTGGQDTETNAELAARQPVGMASPAIVGRTNMEALLRNHASFAGIPSMSIVGLGHPEMLRDKHTIWPGSLGGRIDWYVRSQERVSTTSLRVTATLISKTADNRGLWQFAVNKSDAPGFYDVVKILPVNSDQTLGGYGVVTDTRGVDMSNESVTPDIANATEGAYTAFQTAVIVFKDEDLATNNLTAGSSTNAYDVTLRHFPQIRELQDFVSDGNRRHRMADVLIKAPVPCFLQVSFEIQTRAGDDLPDSDAIRNAVAKTVNRYGFTGRLSSSLLAKTVHQYLTGAAALSAIDMFGIIRRPNGSIKPIRSTEVLIIPDEPALMVTPRTTAFLLDPSDVGIVVRQVEFPDV